MFIIYILINCLVLLAFVLICSSLLFDTIGKKMGFEVTITKPRLIAAALLFGVCISLMSRVAYFSPKTNNISNIPANDRFNKTIEPNIVTNSIKNWNEIQTNNESNRVNSINRFLSLTNLNK